MQVSELIEQLKQLPLDAKVIVDGYEGGFSDIKRIALQPIRPYPNSDGLFGPYAEPDAKHPATETAALLSRHRD